ncbi:uncharacterized protein LOC144120563 [Amblyomma americanum]
MDLMKLLRSDLLSLCEELGVDVEEKMKKSHICTLLLETANEETVSDTWELLKAERKKKEDERKKEEDERKKEEDERERKREETERQRLVAEREERELRRLQLANDQKKLECESSRGMTPERVSQAESFPMDRLMQPYKIGEDLGYYLVNFERTCEKRGYAKETWPQKLLMVLPCEAATIVARLDAKDADDYEKVKASLLRKYRLSAEEFRQRFRGASKRSSESYAEFAFSLKANLTEWLKGAEAYDTKDKVVECVGLEQFYNSIPEAVKLWVQDRENVSTVEKAAELADEYATRRKLSSESSESEKKAFGLRKRFIPKNRSQFRNRETVEGIKQAPEKTEDRAKQAGAQKALTKEFEARKPFRCFNCQETGHIAARCTKTRLAFSYANDSDENLELLRPYIHELQVNGKLCRVLRDSGATMDIVHPSYVKEEDFTGEVAWIRQVLENQSVCLPMARVVISGPFGELATEAAVSSAVSLQYPYLFSNKSNQLLCDRGQKLAEGTVKALTRSKSRELASKLRYSQESEATGEREGIPEIAEPSKENAVRAHEQQQEPVTEGSPIDASLQEACSPDSMLLPTSLCMDRLLRVDRDSLITEQERDPSLSKLHFTAKEGIARRNVTLHHKGGLLYRHYRDKKGKTLDQLVVPEKYRSDLLGLCHGNSWSGHLGVNKTKERLLGEYYWPGCFRDAERYVQSCDACQRTGKPGERWKAPLKLVPLISEPFRRLVIDTVGPLPRTKSGYKYVLTMICPATKFPEAVPLKELSSAEIVDGLLSVFARIGFPAEIQADQGTVFTSALTTTFLQRCGVRLIHSSVYHPQSNSVEKWHSVLKRVLRASCYEHKDDWESCLPATLFALRTVPHEATGFTPAELVYGRALRSPLRMLREMWEGTGESQSVVEYVLQLLNRLSATRELVDRNLKTAQDTAKKYYDKNARLRTFKTGDHLDVRDELDTVERYNQICLM